MKTLGGWVHIIPEENITYTLAYFLLAHIFRVGESWSFVTS